MNEKLIRIENEEQAWAIFEAVSQGSSVVDEGVRLEFSGWPVLEFKVQGRRWKSSIPTRIMPPILEVQRDLYRAYARVRYGEPDLRRLSDEEREALEIVVRVGEGSSEFWAVIESAMNAFVSGALSKMTGWQMVVSILGVALVIGGRLSWKDWLVEQARKKEIETRVHLSKEETRRLDLLARTARVEPLLSEAKEDASESRSGLVRALEDPDMFDVAGVQIPGSEARMLSSKPRERSVPIRIDGQFRILGVNSADPTAFRLHLRRVLDEQEIHVIAREEALSQDMRDALQRGEWERKPVQFSINANELRGKIVAADVVSARLIEGP